MKPISILLALSWAAVVFLACRFAPASAGQQEQPEFIKQGQQLMREGKLDDALTLYRRNLETAPNSIPANIAAGSVLDLMGRGAEARKYFQNAIDAADTPERKANAQRAMAMSYGFEGNCAQTVAYQQQVLDYAASLKDFVRQGEIANEAARVCIDAGDLETAYKWYRIQCMVGQTYEGLRENDRAVEFYRKAAAATAHNAQAAYAIPFSKRRLAALAK